MNSPLDTCKSSLLYFSFFLIPGSRIVKGTLASNLLIGYSQMVQIHRGKGKEHIEHKEMLHSQMFQEDPIRGF